MKKLSFAFLAIAVCYAIFYLSSIKFAQVDKVYFINLDRSVARKERMLQNLKEAALESDAVRFSAYDGKAVLFVNKENGDKFSGEEYIKNRLSAKGHFDAYCTSNTQNPDFIEMNYKAQAFNGRIPGEIGCICSHKKIWEETILNNYKNVLILEDDTNFIQNFPTMYARALDNAPKDYDLLYLNVENFGKAYKNKAQNQYIRIFMNFFDQHIKNPFWKQVHKNIGSAKAYIISQEGAKKLLKCSEKIFSEEYVAPDIVLAKCIEKEEITAYSSKPRLVEGEDIKSDVGE